jgi:hypothetical protein
MKGVVGGALFTILVLTELSGGLSCAEWIPIDGTFQSPGVRTIYIDPASVRREHALVTLSVLIDWTSMQGGRSPTRFSSTIFTKQIDCLRKLVRSLAATDFYGPMGTGLATPGIGYTSESMWRDIEPDSLSQGVEEMVCGNR